MIVQTVQLRYSPHPQRPACARFVAGRDAAAWLRELSDWDVPLDELALYIVPESPRNLMPRGVLAIHPRCATTGSGPQYGLVADRLYAPVEANFQPSIGESEWPTLLGNGIAYIWHPHSGLIGYEPSERLRIADLLEFGAPPDADWSHADPGIAESPRLVALMVPQPPPIQVFLESGGDGIGADAPKLKNLPPGPGERNPLLGALPLLPQLLQMPLAFIARAITSRAPTGASAPTWVNKVENWANSILQDWSKIWNARHRELNRLLQMLETNPDEGLRYAIPYSDFAHRGKAPPGTQLTPHNLDFGLGGGAGAADFWQIPYEMQAQLNAKYRALADREVALGRYRRAAYIHAHLLNDYAAAAGVLAKGGHFREAAAIYKDRLHRPWDAAKCLEEAGLLHEAIPLYIEIKNFEKAGDLYARLDETESAHNAWKQAVDQCVMNRDALSGARICEAKLEEPDSAVEMLLTGWRQSWQGERCLTEMFTLLGRLGRHDSALRRLEGLRDNDDPADGEPATARGILPDRLSHRPTVSALVTIFEQYPDGRVRDRAADVARIAASRALVSRHAEGHVCARLLERLAPADRLLGRDCRRYVGERERTKQVAPVRRAEQTRGRPQFVRSITLPDDIEGWKSAASTSYGIYVLGAKEHALELQRYGWEDDREGTRTRWLSHFDIAHRPVLMAVDPDEKSAFIPVMPVGGPPLPPRRLPASDQFPKAGAAETPGWLDDGTAAIDIANYVLWSLELPLSVVKCISATGVVLRSTTLDDFHVPHLDQHDPPSCALHARYNEAFTAVNHCLWRLSGDRQEMHECGSRIHSIAGSAHFTRTRIALFCEHGGEVWWPTHRGGKWAKFDDGDDPLGTFLRDGRLVVCTRDAWRVYDTTNERLTLQSESPAPLSGVWAVVSTPHGNEFAVCTRQSIAIYRCPQVE